MQSADLGNLRRVWDPRLHPDGRRVAFTVTAIDIEGDTYVSEVWMWDGESAAAFTAGPKDSSPRWSPDGSHLAFLRSGPDDSDKPQLAMIPASGGEARVITDVPLGVSEIEWSPAGERIAFVGTDWRDEWVDVDEDERKRMPRRITELPYRGDGRGWLHDRRSHVYVIEVGADAEPQCLTPGVFNESSPAWNPAGDRLAFISARHDSRGLDPGSQVFEVAATGGEAVAIGDAAAWSSITYSPDGALHAVGQPGLFDWPGVVGLYRRDGDGWIDMTSHSDRSITTFSPPLVPAGPQWTDDGVPLGYSVDRGRIHVVRLDGDELLVGGDRLVTGFSAISDGTSMAFTATSPTDPGELWWSQEGTETCLTSINEEFKSSAGLVEPEEITVDTPDGPVHGWVYLPPGDEQVKVLFNIHGGPAAQYGLGFFDEFQVYVGAGYGVVACNPRGSDGYGQAHLRGVVGEWQKDDPADLRDLQAFIAGALDRFPRLDRSHVGVMGGSYGGLITVRILAVDQSYTSAVAERGLYDWVSFGGASDIGPWFDRAYVDAQLPDGDEDLWKASSLSRAGSITTPTLIIHSDSDFRTPIDQGQQLYVLLRRIGTETELVWFPGEGHELSRGGKPKHRVERFEAILDWHDRHC